jgi:hypothetical protein
MTEHMRMQLEIPESAHVQIIVRSPVTAASGNLLPALFDAASAERPAPRSSPLLLKGGLIVMLLVASFAAGDYFAGRPRSPELARAAAALPRPAPAGEQHPFPDRPLSREATSAVPSGQIPAEFQKQLQQPPTVIPPTGQVAAPPAAGSSPPPPPDRGPGVAGAGSTPAKNPFGLEN